MREIARRLHELGRHDDDDTVSTTTYDLWRRERIAKLGYRRYCSLHHIPPGVTPIPAPGAP